MDVDTRIVNAGSCHVRTRCPRGSGDRRRKMRAEKRGWHLRQIVPRWAVHGPHSLRSVETEMHAGEMERISLDPKSACCRRLACAANIGHLDPQSTQAFRLSVRCLDEA